MKDITTAIAEYQEHIVKLRTQGDPGIKTPYPKLNNALMDGLPKNTLTTIAGFSGTGKTSYLLNILFNSPILNKDLEVLLFTLEMPARSLISRRVSNKARVSVKELYTEDLDVDVSVLDDIKDLPIYFDHEGGTIPKIYNKCDSFIKARKGKEVLIAVDHSLLTDGNDDNEKVTDLAMAFNKLKLANPNANFIIVSQLNDSLMEEYRINKGGMLLWPQYRDLINGLLA